MVEVALACAAFLPFAWHRLRVGYALKQGPLQPTIGSDKIERIVWLLPVWNEELIIESKLNDLALQQSSSVEVHLHIVDSASNDATVSIIDDWVKRNRSKFNSITVDVMNKRLGKSAAVARSLELIGDKFDLVIMTDADARILGEAIPRILEWFSNPMIGAVGGTPVREGATSVEQIHRDMFTVVRLGESIIDSTPFLEGSLLAFRTVISASDIAIGANADDAQIATAIREYGLRSVQDSKLHFSDQLPTTRKSRMRQKVRRGQGIQRLLIRKRSHWIGKTRKKVPVVVMLAHCLNWRHIFVCQSRLFFLRFRSVRLLGERILLTIEHRLVEFLLAQRLAAGPSAQKRSFVHVQLPITYRINCLPGGVTASTCYPPTSGAPAYVSFPADSYPAPILRPSHRQAAGSANQTQGYLPRYRRPSRHNSA